MYVTCYRMFIKVQINSDKLTWATIQCETKLCSGLSSYDLCYVSWLGATKKHLVLEWRAEKFNHEWRRARRLLWKSFQIAKFKVALNDFTSFGFKTIAKSFVLFSVFDVRSWYFSIDFNDFKMFQDQAIADWTETYNLG